MIVQGGGAGDRAVCHMALVCDEGSVIHGIYISGAGYVDVCAKFVDAGTVFNLTSDQIRFAFTWGASVVIFMFVLGFCVASIISVIKKLP